MGAGGKLVGICPPSLAAVLSLAAPTHASRAPLHTLRYAMRHSLHTISHLHLRPRAAALPSQPTPRPPPTRLHPASTLTAHVFCFLSVQACATSARRPPATLMLSARWSARASPPPPRSRAPLRPPSSEAPPAPAPDGAFRGPCDPPPDSAGVRHQREVATGYFDAISEVVTEGTSSTTALKGSTEAAQF